jgi:hypothetical protein
LLLAMLLACLSLAATGQSLPAHTEPKPAQKPKAGVNSSAKHTPKASTKASSKKASRSKPTKASVSQPLVGSGPAYDQRPEEVAVS